MVDLFTIFYRFYFFAWPFVPSVFFIIDALFADEYGVLGAEVKTLHAQDAFLVEADRSIVAHGYVPSWKDAIA